MQKGCLTEAIFLIWPSAALLNVAMAVATTCWYPQIWIWKQPQEPRSIILEHEPPIKAIKAPKVDPD